MLRNYLAVALRNLRRNRLYTGIGMASLTVGFTAALVCFLFIRDELSYDRFIPGHEQIYRISMSLNPPDGSHAKFEGTNPEMAAWLKLDFPSIAAVARLDNPPGSLRRGQVESKETISWVDPEFFAVFQLQAIAGDIDSALLQPDSIVLTRSVARKFFGKDAPIGETIELDRKHLMRVTAVLEDLPSNTHLDLSVIASARSSFSPFATHDRKRSGVSIRCYTYFRLKPGAAVDAIQRELTRFVARHWQAETAWGVQLELLPIAMIHLQPAGIGAMKPAGARSTVYAVAASGLMVILAAGFNFINLVTARAFGRAIEVGMRKVCGARRRDLVLQFLGESFIYVTVAMIVAVALVELLLPYINVFMDRTLKFDYWTDLTATSSMIGAIVAASILVGTYPALILASLPLASVLKGRLTQSGNAGIRRLLVAVQFCILIGLLIATAVMNRQMSYATQERLRLNQDSVLLVRSECEAAFKAAVLTLAGVLDAACSRVAPTDFQINQGDARGPNGKNNVLSYDAVDFGFFELYGLRPVAGRFFDRTHGSDAIGRDELSPSLWGVDVLAPEGKTRASRYSAVINESAVHKLGFETPAASIGQTFLRQTGPDTADTITIIGVVEDFPIESIREPIRPTAYIADLNSFALLSLKLSGNKLPETVRAIDQLWAKLGPPRAIVRLFLNEHIERLYQSTIRQAQMFEIFSGMAVFLSCLGLLGLAAFSASQRTKEIGIRKAMGAGTIEVMRLLVWQFTKPVLWANLIAWPVSAVIMERWLKGFAYRVDLEPWLFFTTTTLVLIVALLTVSLHCYLVAREKPIHALRYE